jgi:ankyrin repeat protein
VSGDLATVKQMLGEGIDPNRRDYVGRAPLHVAILCRQRDITKLLIDADARMTARLVDGRTSLHLAAQLGEVEIIQMLLQRSEKNAQEAEANGSDSSSDAMDTDTESLPESNPDTDLDRPSSEDDWSSEGSDERPVKVSRKEAALPLDDTAGALPEDSEEEPDVFDINLPDWDLAFTPLGHAVAAGSLDAVNVLLTAGADPSVHTKAKHYSAEDLHPLTLTLAVEDPDNASRVAARLIMAGAKSSNADSSLLSTFHRILRAPDCLDLLLTILRCDHSAKVAMEYPFVIGNTMAVFPAVSVVDLSEWGKLAGEPLSFLS